MLVQNCIKNGQSGFKWGDSGEFYAGQGARKKALKQGIDIEMGKKKRGEPSEFDKSNSRLYYEIGNELSLVEQLSIHSQIKGIKVACNDI
jgi:hypothetical protein